MEIQEYKEQTRGKKGEICTINTCSYGLESLSGFHRGVFIGTITEDNPISMLIAEDNESQNKGYRIAFISSIIWDKKK